MTSITIKSVSSVITALAAVATNHPNVKIDKTVTVPLGGVPTGSPITGPVLDENGLELNFNGACPYRHVARVSNNDGTYSYVAVLYCPVGHPDRSDIETAKQMNDSSTTSNLFVRGGKFADPRDAAWVAREIAKDPLVAWLEYFDCDVWEAPQPPNWKGSPVADGSSIEEFVSNGPSALSIRVIIEQV